MGEGGYHWFCGRRMRGKGLAFYTFEDCLKMKKTTSTTMLAQRWLWFFITLHVLVWTLIPNWTRHALPMDASEGAVWGQTLAWGYDRNPWLNAWLTRLAVALVGNSDIFIYFFSQVFVALAFWSVWRLGRKMLMPLQAVVAVLMLEAVQYYTLAAVAFNDNVLELGLWPLLVLFFYKAITSQRRWDWLGVGLIAGLAMMTKYYSTILFLAMCIFLIWHPKARESFKKSGFYAGILLFIVMITPHIIWLFQHDFIPIHYALRRVNDNTQTTFWHYIQPGLNFGFMQLMAFLGAVGLFLFALWGKKNTYEQIDDSPTLTYNDVLFNRQFLWVVGVGPYLITVLLALLAGWQLHTLWGTPLLSCWGLLLVHYTQPIITRARFYRFIAAVLIVFAAFIGAYTWAMLKPGNTGSGNFPARAFATDITNIWHVHYKQALPYVMGDRVLASNVTRYSLDKPQAHLGWDSAMNPWIDEKALRREGAVFVQRLDEGSDFPADVRQRFPGLKIEGIHYMRYVRAARDSKPIAILVGILPPGN
jgi:4-amino-4-deoxy-L-arabinose transferase-like glycosyltransferase